MLKRRLAIAAIVMALALVLAAPALAFPDVPASHPNAEAINTLASEGLISGYASGLFGPHDSIKRAQFAKMIVGLLSLPVTESDVSPFSDVTDVPGDLYPAHYVAVAAKSGLTQGRTPTTFVPYAPITRAQVLTMIVRACDAFYPQVLPAVPVGWRGSVPASDPTHGHNIARAEFGGLLENLGLETFSPGGSATRAEVAQIMFNLEQKAQIRKGHHYSISGARAVELVGREAMFLQANGPWFGWLEQWQDADHNFHGEAVLYDSITDRTVRLGENTQFVSVYGNYAFYSVATGMGPIAPTLAFYSYDLRTGARQVLASPIVASFETLAFSTDRRYLVARTGYDKGPLVLVDLATRVVKEVVPDFQNPSFTWNKNYRRVAAVSYPRVFWLKAGNESWSAEVTNVETGVTRELARDLWDQFDIAADGTTVAWYSPTALEVEDVGSGQHFQLPRGAPFDVRGHSVVYSDGTAVRLLDTATWSVSDLTSFFALVPGQAAGIANGPAFLADDLVAGSANDALVVVDLSVRTRSVVSRDMLGGSASLLGLLAGNIDAGSTVGWVGSNTHGSQVFLGAWGAY
jgi:S-layer homology domain